jgi:transcriptional regulator with XRE-family HTH domain
LVVLANLFLFMSGGKPDMGRRRRERPKRLAEKLMQIRQGLGLTQTELIRHLGFEDELTKRDISAFERGSNEPNLMVLLAYSEVANLYVEVLIKDSLDLPLRIPAPKKNEGIPLPSKKLKKS